MNSKLTYLAVFAVLTAVIPAQAGDRNQMAGAPATLSTYPSLYGITGARDDGSADNTGIATTVHCTNPTPYPAHVQFLIWNYNNVLRVNQTYSLGLRQTFTASTHRTVLYDEDVSLASGVLNEGFISIRSDNAQLLCSAEVIDASSSEKLAVTLSARSTNGGG